MRPGALGLAATLLVLSTAGGSLGPAWERGRLARFAGWKPADRPAGMPALRAGDADRGKAIYLRGESPANRPITAVLGSDSDTVPAAIVPCVNCHGDDGRGKPEGGIRPADITPEALGRTATINGRLRPAYTRPLLKRAITMGFDSGRQELNAAMPRYRMSIEDADDLLAYLEKVGHEPQPGVTNDTLRIRVVGDAGPLPGAQIYGRSVRFVREGEAFLTIDASDDPSASLAAAERERVPTIVVRPSMPITGRFVFSLTASDDDQLAALRTYARGQDSIVVAGDCTATLARAATLPHPPLVLMTATSAKSCDIAAIPAALDHRVIVAAPLPPTAEATHDAVTVALTIATRLLAQLGRDATRSQLIDALEHVYRVDTHLLPPITWEPNRHNGTKAAWLMTVDVPLQRLLAKPGWVDGAAGE
jgi:mono/diheme cytochrome c family protein